MVKRSKTSKSKRITLKQKHKVIRKVKEHHKKKAKEAKKLGLNKKRKVEKDPGIPNDWPFKALEARALEEIEQKKAAHKERAQKRKLGLLVDGEEQSLEQRNNDLGGIAKSRVSKTDNLEKGFYEELVKVIEESDVILEVLNYKLNLFMW